MDRPKQFEKSAESEVWNAIAAFEEILAAMPDDRSALETLFDAYDHIGDKSRALDYLIRIAGLIREENDSGPLPWVYENLARLGKDSAEAAVARKELEEMAESMGMPSPGEMVTARESSAGKKGIDVSSELSLAWQLRQDNQVTEDEYSVLVQDITENSTKQIDVPVSVLHVMQDRTFKELPRVLGHISRDTGVPIIRMADFGFDRRVFSSLPATFTSQKGAMVFDELGGEYLVAILNPYNESLRREVGDILKRACHFYLVAAEDYDAYLNRSRQVETAAAVL